MSYKGLLNGIEVIFTEESYTSRASFFDKDELPEYGESDNPKFSGRRIKRGLYKDSKGNIWNADLNGAANIMRKASDKAYKGIDEKTNSYHIIKIKVALNLYNESVEALAGVPL